MKWSILVAVMLLACGMNAEAQQPAKKIWRIGYLSNTDASGESVRSNAVRMALRELGYIEGHNIAIDYRYAEGKQERYSELAVELVRLKVDAIVVSGGTGVVHAAKKATKTIPIIMVGAPIDPVQAGLVNSLARPGGNVTGLTSLSRELGGKRLELLKEAVPKLTRVAVLYDPTSATILLELKEDLPVAARALGLTIQPWEVRAADDFAKVFAAMGKDRPDALYVPSGALVSTNRKQITGFALKNRLPSMFGRKDAVEEGVLMYYGADLSESNRQIAWYIDKILKGAKPEDLPVQQPMKFEFVINLRTAKQIGLTIPQWTLMKADRVIK